MENYLDQYDTLENISPSKFEDYFESFQTSHDMQIRIDIDQNFDVLEYKEKSKKKTKNKLQFVGCNCMKTKCLKLYCECFANKSYCKKSCKCRNCQNSESFGGRGKAVVEAFERNPDAFQHSRYTCTRGCNCRMSGCKKKYCSCFLNGVLCTAVCTCEKCRNIKIR